MTAELERPTTAAEMYEHFFVPGIFRPLSQLVLQVARLRPGQQVLDLACGTGILARQVAPKIGAAGKVFALDLRPGMLAVARSQPAPEGAPIVWREGDAVRLDLPDGVFDVVLCQQGLQFFADRAAALREMKRVSKRGGQLVLAVWQDLARHELFRAMAEVEFKHLAAFGLTMEDATAPFSLGGLQNLRELFEQAGLQGIEIEAKVLEVRLPAKRFVENMDFAYSAVVPHLAADPCAFAAFIDVVTRETEELRERHRQGDSITFPMHTHIITASA